MVKSKQRASKRFWICLFRKDLPILPLHEKGVFVRLKLLAENPTWGSWQQTRSNTLSYSQIESAARFWSYSGTLLSSALRRSFTCACPTGPYRGRSRPNLSRVIRKRTIKASAASWLHPCLWLLWVVSDSSLHGSEWKFLLLGSRLLYSLKSIKISGRLWSLHNGPFVFFFFTTSTVISLLGSKWTHSFHQNNRLNEIGTWNRAIRLVFP